MDGSNMNWSWEMTPDGILNPQEEMKGTKNSK